MIWERIRQKDTEEQRARFEATQRHRAEEEERLRQKREKEAKATQKAAEEKSVQLQHLMTLLHESRLIQHMVDLKKGIGGKRDIVFGGDVITLYWGRYHIEEETELVLSEHTLKRGNVSYSSITRVQDYSYIRAEFNLWDESLKINGRNIPREKWRGRQDVIVDALADAYLNPRRYRSSKKENKERSSSSSSSSGSQPECCHS